MRSNRVARLADSCCERIAFGATDSSVAGDDAGVSRRRRRRPRRRRWAPRRSAPRPTAAACTFRVWAPHAHASSSSAINQSRRGSSRLVDRIASPKSTGPSCRAIAAGSCSEASAKGITASSRWILPLSLCFSSIPNGKPLPAFRNCLTLRRRPQAAPARPLRCSGGRRSARAGHFQRLGRDTKRLAHRIDRLADRDIVVGVADHQRRHQQHRGGSSPAGTGCGTTATAGVLHPAWQKSGRRPSTLKSWPLSHNGQPPQSSPRLAAVLVEMLGHRLALVDAHGGDRRGQRIRLRAMSCVRAKGRRAACRYGRGRRGA